MSLQDLSQNRERRISERHIKMLEASVISREVAEARGYETVTSRAELKRRGFSEAQALAPTLLAPIWGIGGEIVLLHHRPDSPRIRDGKTAKYEFPTGARMAVDVHPFLKDKVRDPSIPLFVTEGVKKADAAISAGLCCIALPSVWTWRGTNEWGGKTTLPDWEGIALKGSKNQPRQVYICFDSDVMLKESVHLAMSRLAAFLQSRGAKVAFIYLPHGDSGQKTGLDDFLAAGHTTEDLFALATNYLREMPAAQSGAAEETAPNLPYRETTYGIVWDSPTRDGSIPRPLTDFCARIVADIEEDDGAEVRHSFEVEAKRTGHIYRFTISASAFMQMNWPTEHIGASAAIYPGQGIKDHARFAIQRLSGEIPRTRVFGHAGWREISPGKWAFLHSSGIIGSDQSIKVNLPQMLSGFHLPDPPSGNGLLAAIRASLDILRLVPDHIGFPALAALYRAPFGMVDSALHFVGSSGVFKSEFAALLQQHFGAGLDARHFLGSWSGTANSLERIAFLLKDGVFVIDDFAPTGSAQDVARLQALADRLIRAQGNNAGRSRMNADGSLRPTNNPRALIIITGEDVPQGHSVRARLLIIEITPGMIDPVRLSACQKDAADGLYAQAMSGFLSWIAPQYEAIQQELHAVALELRQRAQTSGQHKRTPGIVASLGAGLHLFLRFALEVGAITEAEREVLWQRGWAALGQSAEAQSQHQTSSEPTARYRELLASALASGRAHLAGMHGAEPETPSAWGWRQKEIGAGDSYRTEWQPQGERVGWTSGEDVYLEPDAAYAVVRRLGESGGDSLTISAKTLHKRLHEKGLLLSVEDSRSTLTVRKMIDGQRRRVLHMRAGILSAGNFDNAPSHDDVSEDPESSTPPSFDASGQVFGGIGQKIGQFMDSPKQETDQKNSNFDHDLRWDENANGQIGQFGQVSGTLYTPEVEDGEEGMCQRAILGHLDTRCGQPEVTTGIVKAMENIGFAPSLASAAIRHLQDAGLVMRTASGFIVSPSPTLLD